MDPARHAELEPARRAELEARLRRVRARIAAACAAAGRDAAGITLVAITKTWPASDVRLLYELGQRDFGENRDQEAAPKAAQCAGLPITWHFVGQLQTNKAASVASYADIIHSVDRLRLVRALGNAARREDRLLTCLIQVDLGNADSERGGAPPRRCPPSPRPSRPSRASSWAASWPSHRSACRPRPPLPGSPPPRPRSARSGPPRPSFPPA